MPLHGNQIKPHIKKYLPPIRPPEHSQTYTGVERKIQNNRMSKM